MPEITSAQPGSFCWVDLHTTDVEAAKAFYSELFGWKTRTDEMPGGGTYTMLSVGDKIIGGLGGQTEDMKKQGVLPMWTSYVAVASADDAVAKAVELGGTVIAPAFDVMEAGRMAVLLDPTGAVFSVWQSKQHHGAELWAETGAPCWNELATRDADKAKQFYAGLFGWQPNTKEGPFAYTEWEREGTYPAGGMLQMDGDKWDGIPPHWMVYFAVEDVDQSATRASSLGGTLKVPPTDIPDVGRFSVIQDPQGGVFSIFTMSAKHA